MIRVPHMNTRHDAPPLLRFADFELDPAGPALRRLGNVVPLRPKSLSLIAHLAARPGQLVRKEDLVDAVRGDTAVTDATLARTIFDAREALGDDFRQARSDARPWASGPSHGLPNKTARRREPA